MSLTRPRGGGSPLVPAFWRSRPPAITAPPVEEGVPVAYQCQVLHQLAVTGHACRGRCSSAVRIFDLTASSATRRRSAIRSGAEAHFWQQVRQDWQPGARRFQRCCRRTGLAGSRDDGQTVDPSDSPSSTSCLGNPLQLPFVAQAKWSSNRESLIKQRLQATLVKLPPGCSRTARSP